MGRLNAIGRRATNRLLIAMGLAIAPLSAEAMAGADQIAARPPLDRQVSPPKQITDRICLTPSTTAQSHPPARRSADRGGCTGSELIYRHDDGTYEVGVRSDGTHGGWLNTFTIEGDAVVIEAIDVAFAIVTESAPAAVYLWSDPNGDGDPTDAEVLASATLTATDYLVQRVDIPDTYIGEAGTTYFVGVLMAYAEPVDAAFPAAYDNSEPNTTGVSWIIGANSPLNPDDLTDGAIEFALIEDALGGATMDLGVRAVSTATFDCNDNGVPDHEEINDGIADDCNSNCIPDDCEVLEADCNGNGLPDDCDLGGEPVPVYAYDDGFGDNNIGLSGAGDVIWLNHFTIQPNGEVLAGMKVAFGLAAEGTPALVHVWDDPNGDGNPSDANTLWTFNMTVQAPDTNQFIPIPFDDGIILGPEGTSFFVGVQVMHATGEYPARIDQSSDQQESWLAAGSDVVDPDNLANAPIFGLTGGIGFPGNWMIRVIPEADIPPNDCNVNGIPDECDIADGGADSDCNGNGVPDSCEIDADDCNGNGLPDECDPDCNGDGIPDDCQVPESDCDNNGIEDECQLKNTGLVGLYYDNDSWEGDFVLSRIDSEIDFSENNFPPAPMPPDNFSVRWVGSLVPPTTGTYTLSIEHDDSGAVYLNSSPVIPLNGTGTHTTTADLVAGQAYHLRVDFAENSFSHYCKLRWIPPGGSLDIIPTAHLRPVFDSNANNIPDICDFGDCDQNDFPDNIDLESPLGRDCNGDGILDSCQAGCDCDNNGFLDSCEADAPSGLIAQYFKNDAADNQFVDRVLVRIDSEVDFDWGGGSPHPSMPNNEFTIRWTGTVTTTAAAGVYEFFTQTDDGVRLWVDDEQLIDQWVPQSSTEHSGSLSLDANTVYSIRMEYFEDGGDAVARLSWRPPDGQKTIIPSSALGPMNDSDGDGIPDTCNADCNGNGVPDSLDLADGTSSDCNGNCTPDECDVVIQVNYGQAHWRFEQIDGNSVIDSGPNDMSGTFDNGLATYAADVATDPVPQTGLTNSQSLDLNWQSTSASGTYTVNDTNGVLSMGNQDFTIEAWVKLDHLSTTGGANQRQYLCQKKPLPSQDGLLDYAFLVQRGNNEPIPNYGEYTGSGREMQLVFGSGTNTSSRWGATSNLEINDLEWHLVSVAFDANRRVVRFGLDGQFEEVQISSSAPSHTTNDGPLRVGGHQNGTGTDNHFLRGAIDEMRISRGVVPTTMLLDAQGYPYSNDDDANGTPDECGCEGDVTGDGIIDVNDVLQVIAAWGGTDPDADVNGDGTVGVDDLLIVIKRWGPCP
ncbi:MAG: PA14 domain-containing protein [Phycisphaerales bacterium]|nr:PA14 domain-containing protein [Phycisphaerales bacterium]